MWFWLIRSRSSCGQKKENWQPFLWNVPSDQSGERAAENDPTEGGSQSPGVQAEVSDTACTWNIWMYQLFVQSSVVILAP